MRLLGYDLTNGPPICVAEISGSHLGDLTRAYQLINAAADAGAQAVKFQCYEPESLTIYCAKKPFLVKNPLWQDKYNKHGQKTLYKLYQEAHTPIDWMPTLFEVAEERGIPAFASVFCERGLAMLEKVNCPAYKIASMEIVDHGLLKMVAATGKPMILSTGMASIDELSEACGVIGKHDSGVAILHCISGYPTPAAEANLLEIRRLRRLLWLATEHVVGLSDHTLGIAMPVAAVALGAKIIEKHLTLSRSDGGPDAAFSLEPNEFRDMVRAVRDAWDACQPSQARSEDSSRQLRRSLYVVEDTPKDGLLTPANVRSIRPGDGLPPSMLDQVIGRKAARKLERGTPLQMSDIS